MTVKNVAPKSTGPPVGFFDGLQPSWTRLDHSCRCSAAKTMPSAAVASSQRMHAARRPACAAMTATSIVRLLVSSAVVMMTPFTTVGLNANGRPHAALPTRRYP